MRLRKARMRDARKLFEWRNDEDTRNNSRETAPVAWEDHLAWMERNVDPGTTEQVVIVAEDGHGLIGVVRLSHRNSTDGGEVAITIAPERRGEGHGAKFLNLVGERFGGYLVAEIRTANRASRRIFEKCGYLWISAHKGFELYRRPQREAV